jgi:hypothetical protein
MGEPVPNHLKRTQAKKTGRTDLLLKLGCVLLSGMLVCGGSETSAYARTKEEARRVQAAKVKEALQMLGSGEEVRVRVVLFDKAYHEGYVSALGEEQFVVANGETGVELPLGYDEVKRLKATNASTGVELSVPKEMPKALRVTTRIATLGMAGRRGTGSTNNGFLSTPAIVILAVLAVGLILIGVELKKS